MNVYVLLYNSGSENEGIHSIEIKGKTIVLMFEDKDDADRYCSLLEAQDFPMPSVEVLSKNEVEEFCIQSNYQARFVEKHFIPQTNEDRMLLAPPQNNLNVDNWDNSPLDTNIDNDKDLNVIRDNLEKLL